MRRGDGGHADRARAAPVVGLPAPGPLPRQRHARAAAARQRPET